MPTWYIDNNKTVYAMESIAGSMSNGSSAQMEVGLSDIAELPGQSTWFINKIHFRLRGYYDIGTVGTSGLGRVEYLAGVIPRDLGTSTFDSLTDYQTIMGWPLKGCYGKTAAQTDSEFNNWVSISCTYRPRKALVLNREQDICWNVKNLIGKELPYSLSMSIQAKRGN